jgi:hypothetical protein
MALRGAMCAGQWSTTCAVLSCYRRHAGRCIALGCSTCVGTQLRSQRAQCPSGFAHVRLRRLCALRAHKRDVTPLARAQCGISKMCGRAVRIDLVLAQSSFLSGGGGWSGGGGGVGVGGTGHRVSPAHRREPRASKPKARPPLRPPPSHKPKTTKRKKDKENSDLSRRQKKKHVLRPAAYVIAFLEDLTP